VSGAVELAAFQWLTTSPNPRVADTGFDAGQRGWRLHAVKATKSQTFAQVNGYSAACGLRPPHGWGMDLFIERRCSRCLVALGVACVACRGRGMVGKNADHCDKCFGRGVTEAGCAALAACGERS
jgi:hypothetical protein